MPARTRSEAHSPTIQAGSAPEASAASAAFQHLVRHLRRQVVDVGAPVAVLGDLGPVADRDDRRAEVPHLRPEVVEVVLPRDLVTGRLEDAAEEVAHEGAAGIADVEGARGVGRDELHVDVSRVVGA